MSTSDSNSHVFEPSTGQGPEQVSQQIRDISEVPAIEVITTAAVHLMSAAAVKLGLAAEDNAEELKDLDEARKLITALAGLVTAAAPEIGSQHAGPLRDGLRSLQLAFREESIIPDAPGKGPGEKYTGPVNCSRFTGSSTRRRADQRWSARRRRLTAAVPGPPPEVPVLDKTRAAAGQRGGGAGAAAPGPARQSTTPAAPTATNPAEGPMPSMNTPASGAPSATPAGERGPVPAHGLAAAALLHEVGHLFRGGGQDRRAQQPRQQRKQAQRPGVLGEAHRDGQGGHAEQQEDRRNRPVHGAVEQPADHGGRTPEEEDEADLRLVPAGLQRGHNAHVRAAEHHPGARPPRRRRRPPLR